MLFELVLDLEIRLTHLDERLGVVATGDDTTVVVAQHHYGYLRQVGPKDPFATGIEAVAVDQRKGRLLLRHGCVLCW